MFACFNFDVVAFADWTRSLLIFVFFFTYVTLTRPYPWGSVESPTQPSWRTWQFLRNFVHFQSKMRLECPYPCPSFACPAWVFEAK